MKWLLRIKIFALICLSAFLISLTYVTLLIPGLFTDFRVSTIAEISRTSEKLDHRLESITNTVDDRLESIETGVLGESKAIRYLANNRLISMEGKVDSQITRTNDNLEKLLEAYTELPSEFKSEYATNIKPYLDCENNGLCIQNSIVDTSLAIRTTARQSASTMDTIKTEFPKITVNLTKVSNNAQQITDTFARDIPKITNNVAGVAQNINQLTKPRWYDRLIGYGLNGVVMYRNLNPATNLTIKGVQAVANTQ